MKYFFAFLFSLAVFSGANAQEQTAKLLQETARTLVQKGDYDNAITILERARVQEPDNVEILKDLSFACYLKRDFAKAIEVGKEMIEKPAADEQAFQMLGLSYKAIASYKECSKLYKTGLSKFPNSGVLYYEAAELLAMDKDLEGANALWEKGIEVNPLYSGNYYNASIYYARKNNWIRCVLYSEMFLNLESYSKRSEEIKDQLFNAYNNLLAPGVVKQSQDAKSTSAFEKTVLEVMAKVSGNGKARNSIDDLISTRTKFMVEWMQGKQKTYPFQLFNHEQYLLSQGLFEAYNYWLLSTASGAGAYEAWQKDHPKETEGYKAFQQSRVFKLPVGEYYFSR
jgi:tetratricopeptide (TPR) repeat protein